MLKLTGVADINRNIRCLTVTMESLDDIQVENLQKAGEELEIQNTSFIIMDHEESFYYYIMTQKTEQDGHEFQCETDSGETGRSGGN